MAQIEIAGGTFPNRPSTEVFTLGKDGNYRSGDGVVWISPEKVAQEMEQQMELDTEYAARALEVKIKFVN
jgi:hypothetical protein